MKKLNFIVSLSSLLVFSVQAQVPDPSQGLRAAWMRGAWGALWLPETTYNGKIEGVTIDEFITQIKDIRTIDYVQIGLTNPNIYSPVHTAPHDIIESLWKGDTDANGNLINLVVPRASKPDPFLSWLKALKAAGLRVEVYVNSYNLLARIPESIPAGYPDLSARWRNWCDTNITAQAFIKSQSYHTDGVHTNRPYIFCYAEFILKEYAVRYGDLIDAWCFDSADNIMEDECGDDPGSDDLDDQKIYAAFANACHAGNPNAAIAFNNSVGTDAAPFATPTLFDDYAFGHPFGGAGNMVVPAILYTRNFAFCEFMRDTGGLPFKNDDRDWNDNVVGHFFPKQSTTSWNSGNAPCLTDEQFVEWTSTGIINGGAITWGTPLDIVNLTNPGYNLTLKPYALTQLTLADNYLKQFQNPGKPNWSRQATILPDAYIGQTYYCELVHGVDFWDTDKDASVVLINNDSLPSWITITNSATTPGNYILSGIPTNTEPTDYTFSIRVMDSTEGVVREVGLQVYANTYNFTNPGDGTPVWYADTLILPSADISETYSQVLVFGKDFYDFDEGDVPTITKKGEADWLSITELASGVWKLYGTPSISDEGVYIDTLTLSDGTHSVERVIEIKVNQPLLDLTDDYQTVLIKATADTDYGVDNVATMVSDVLTAPDGLATFRISIDVTPMAGKSILSGTSGGLSTTQAWGLGGDGRDATKNNLFFGDSIDWVEIGNIQVLNFNANGGRLFESDFEELVIDFVTVVNAQSGNKDAVAYFVNGDTTDLSNVATSPYSIDVPNVRHFSLGVGYSPSQTQNKWSVEGLGIVYSLGTFFSVKITSENGTVEQTPNNQVAYKSGTQIELVAVPESGYLFKSWSGDTIGATINADTIIVIMDDNKNITAEFSTIVGVKETKNIFNYTISPNPSNGIFQVSMDQMTKGTYSVYSINGTKILHGFANGPIEFDLSNYEKGVYLFKIKSELGVDVKKIILN